MPCTLLYAVGYKVENGQDCSQSFGPSGKSCKEKIIGALDVCVQDTGETTLSEIIYMTVSA